MQAFFAAQLDYIFFFYGLAFILLMAVCSIIARKGEQTGLPWMLLGLFGVSHGCNEWLDMLAISLGDSETFVIARLAVMAVSFIILTEFGRKGLSCGGGRSPGIWIYLPLAAVTAAGGLAGIAGLNAAVRYSFGLCGGALAAAALFRAAGTAAPSPWLGRSATVMALYALTAGAVVPKAPFFPASLLNHAFFLETVGVPIQLVRGILAVLCTALLWEFHNRTMAVQLTHQGDARPAGRDGIRLTLLITFLLLTGWFGTFTFGRYAVQEFNRDILHLSRLAAATIDPVNIAALTGTPADRQSQSYHVLKEQLHTLYHANLELRHFSILMQREGTVFFAVDSIPEGEPGFKVPGTLYLKPPSGLLPVFSSQMPVTLPPFTDEYGNFVAGVVPILDPSGGRTIALFSLSANAQDMHRLEKRYRLIAILLSAFFSVIVTVFFTIIQRMRESGRLLDEVRCQRQQALEQMNDTLEKLVAERTEQLTAANRELRRALEERSRADVLLKEKAALLEEEVVMRRTAQEEVQAQNRVLEMSISEQLKAEGALRKLNDELETQVRQRTLELESVNRELNAFCYSISHDLRAPLRHISGFSQILIEEYAQVLDAEGQHHLKVICDSGARMGRLIDDLLKFSRVARSDVEKTDVDLSELARSIVAMLRDLEPERTVEVVIGEDILVEGDRSLLELVMQNLLGNAWKYSGGKPVARIEFGEMTDGRRRIFFVRDNGAGFDMAYGDKLFGVFQRLHSADQFEGSGIGLATVKRIIERHGGSIWAEGTVGEGATFYFTLD